MINKQYKVALFAVLGILLMTAAASATDYYVSTNGDNSASGDLTHPWQNVAYATQQAVAGDTVYLFDGTWTNEECTFANSGTAEAPITITAYSGTPTLDGTDRTGYGFRLDFNDHIEISHLTISRYYHTICEPGSYVRVSDCDLSDTGGVVIVISQYDSTHNTIENCTLYDSGWNTIQMSGNHEPPNGNGVPATYITVRDCTIYDSVVHNAIDLYGNLQHVLIEGNELYNNPAGCIFEHDYPDHREYVTIRDNYFHDTQSSGINIGANSYYEISDNIFENITGHYPMYLYLDSHDYEIRGNSFYNCLSPRTVGGYNFVFDRNYIHPDSDLYMFSYGSNGTVRNPLGRKQVIAKFGYSMVDLEWDDGTVFTATPYDDYTAWTPVQYYPDKSVCSITSGEDAARIGDVTTYAITLTPENAYLEDVAVAHESEPTDDSTTLTIDSSVSTNPTWISATMQNASATYNISIDGVITDQVTSDADKIASYQYTGSWGPHTFEFEYSDGGAAPPPPPPPASNVVWIATGIDLPVGNLVSVPINIENATGVAGISMTISYTPSVIEIVGGAMGDFTWNYSLNCDDVVGGTATLFTLIDGRTLSGDLTVGTIDVQAVGVTGESSNLVISDVILCDDYGAYIIPDDIIDGSVILSGTVPGDADGNGVVNTLDVLLIMQYLMYPGTTGIDLDAADVCGAPGVDIADATLILSHTTNPAGYPLGG